MSSQKLEQGIISTSMGINSKPSHKLNLNGYWILVDGNMPLCQVNKLKDKIKEITK